MEATIKLQNGSERDLIIDKKLGNGVMERGVSPQRVAGQSDCEWGLEEKNGNINAEYTLTIDGNKGACRFSIDGEKLSIQDRWVGPVIAEITYDNYNDTHLAVWVFISEV